MRLPPRSEFLAGREELLGELELRLARGDDSGPRIVVLTGLGGAGKTAAAVEYAHRHLTEVGVAWQLAAEDPAVLAADFGELAAQLGVRDLLDARDPVASVHGVLARYPAGWLLVFDNAPDPASVEVFLPSAGNGQVLVTSQNPNWPTGQALEVPVLNPEVAAEFLVKRTRDPDRQSGLEVAVELGGLPLALEQAAAYLQATGNGLAGYLAMFRQRRADLLSRGEPAGYIKTVAATWALAFERLQRTEPRAAGLLRLLACCAPEAIPLLLLLQPRTGLADELGAEVAPVLVPLLGDRLAADDAIAALRRYSLVSLSADGLVSVNRLVQVITVDQMPTDLAAQWRRAAAAMIQAAIPSNPNVPGDWPTFALLLPHAQAALATDSEGMERIGSYLGYSGSYPAAQDLYRSVLDARLQVLGPEHPGTLATRSGLARWTGAAGDAAGARDQLAALLPVFKRVLGGKHPDTLTARARLAYWTGAAGDAAGARDQFAALLPMFKRVLGLERPETLAARAYLAAWTGAAGDAAGARDQVAALLPVNERVLGPEHPETLAARAGLAYWTGAAGDAAGARDQVAALLPVFKRVLGLEHPGTLAARAGLAAWTGAAGDAAGARDQVAALLPVNERVLGPEHPETLAARARPGLLDWGGGGCGGGAGSGRGAAAGARAGPRPGAPGHPGRPRRPRRLDWGGGGCGGGAGSGRGTAADVQAGARRQAPGDPGRPRQAWPTGLGRRGMRRGRGISSRPGSRCTSGSSARSTRAP